MTGTDRRHIAVPENAIQHMSNTHTALDPGGTLSDQVCSLVSVAQ